MRAALRSRRRQYEMRDLLLSLREGDYRISKATIYRTLKHLLDAGLIRQVVFGSNKQAHYDFVSAANAHDHLLEVEHYSYRRRLEALI